MTLNTSNWGENLRSKGQSSRCQGHWRVETKM